MKPKIIVLMIIIFLPFKTFTAEYQLLEDYPFKIGESLTFSVKALGVYLADQVTTLHELTTYEGNEAVKGTVTLANSGIASKLYYVDDEETTYFQTDSLNPVFYEKWIQEGKWINHQKFEFHLEEGSISYYTAHLGADWYKTNAPANLMNYLTMILLLRALDYDYYIENDISIEVNYLFDIHVTEAEFIAEYSTMRFERERIDVIHMEDTKGLGFEITLSADENRLPLKIIVPPYDNEGVSVNFKADLIEYELGDEPIHREK